MSKCPTVFSFNLLDDLFWYKFELEVEMFANGFYFALWIFVFYSSKIIFVFVGKESFA